MRHLALSVASVLLVATCAFAQSPDEQMKTSLVAPDLHNVSSGWSRVSVEEGNLVSVQYQDKVLVIRGSQEYYENEKEHRMALLFSRKDASGKSEEVAMLYGTDAVARGAIKVNGKWYVSKELYFENGSSNLNGAVIPEVVYDKTETDKPVKVKFFLETIDGPKEVVFDFQ